MLDGFRNWARDNKLMAAGVVVGGLVVFVWLNIEMLHLSSSPTFCKYACHSVQSRDVEMFELSSHAKRGVECVDCHFQEGALNYLKFKIMALKDLRNRITGNMGRPLDDEEKFDDPEHLRYISEDTWRGEQKMDTIMLPQYLHYPEIDEGAKSNLANEKGQWKIMPERYSLIWRTLNDNCRNCHSAIGNRGHHSPKDVADFVVKNTLLTFSEKVERRRKGIKIPHAVHLDQGIACIDCHQEIVHGPKELKDANGVILPRMEICRACHNDRRAPFDCTLCHAIQKNMNVGTGGVDVQDTPNYMYPDNAKCPDCHLEDNKWKMKSEVCVGCHDQAHADTLANWQNETKNLLAELKPQMAAIEQALAAAKQRGRDITKAQQLFDDADANYSMVVNDGSKGAHNINYTKILLSSAKEKLALSGELLAE